MVVLPLKGPTPPERHQTEKFRLDALRNFAARATISRKLTDYHSMAPWAFRISAHSCQSGVVASENAFHRPWGTANCTS